MSKYRKIKVQMNNREALKKALEQLYPRPADFQEAQDNSLRISWSRQKAEFVVSKYTIGCRYDDLAFVRTDDGYEALVSDHDENDNRKAMEALGMILQSYTYHKVLENAYSQGYTVYEETLADGTVQLALERAY